MKITRKIKEFFYNMNIKNRTLTFVVIVVISSLIVISYIFSYVLSEKNKNDNIEYYQKILRNTKTNLDGYLDEIAAIANNANYDYYLQEYLIEESKSDTSFTGLASSRSMKSYEMSSKIFDNIINSRSDVTSVMIFGQNSLLLYNTMYSYRYLITDYTKKDWYKNAMKNSNEPFVTGPVIHEFLVGNSEKTICVSRTIVSSMDSSLLGVILVDINQNEISQIVDASNSGGEGFVCVLNSVGDVIYEQNNNEDTFLLNEKSNLTNKIIELSENNYEKNFFIDIENEKYQIVFDKIDNANWTLLAITPYSQVTSSIYRILTLVIGIVFLVTILVIFVLNVVLNSSIKPVVQLEKLMEKAEKGDLSVRANIVRQDEVGKLSSGFNNMLEQIQNLMNQVIEKQEEKRFYELQALQAQINPHFLYNTLDSIIWMTETNDKNVVPMTEALAKLFRISLNKGKEIVSIEKEIEHVKNYLFIQSMRYTNKFEYNIHMSNEAKGCKTVKLIIQPLVENSIYHGIKTKKGKGIIDIYVFIDNGNLIIKVKDNGIGMSKENCKNIFKENKKIKTRGSGIGIKNVNERIKLFYGKEYGISYKSNKGEGTVATIKIPVKRTIEGEKL